MSPLAEMGWTYGKICILYVYFMIFGVVNVVIAAFVDSASQFSRRDRELVTQSEMAKSAQYAEDITRFFHDADVDGSGRLTWDEFREYLDCEEVQAYFQSLELDVSQAW